MGVLRGGHFGYRHAHTRATDTPSATPIAPAFQSVARGGGIGGVSIGSASSRNSQLGELEMSQKLLEEKLAAEKLAAPPVAPADAGWSPTLRAE